LNTSLDPSLVSTKIQLLSEMTTWPIEHVYTPCFLCNLTL